MRVYSPKKITFTLILGFALRTTCLDSSVSELRDTVEILTTRSRVQFKP